MMSAAAEAPLFDSHGVAKALLPGDLETYASASPSDAARAADGKLLVVGNVWPASMDKATTWAISRLNADGSPDASFGPDGTGIETVPIGHEGYDEKVLPLAGGKFIVCGWTNDGVVVGRFNADGSVDRGFGGGLRTYTAVRPGWGAGGAAWLTPDGKVQILGDLDHDLIPDMSDYFEAIATLRLNADGTPDESLGQGGLAVGAFTVSMTSLSFDDEQWWFYDNGAIVAAQPMADGGSLLYLEWFSHTSEGGATLARVELDPAGHVRSRQTIHPDIPSQAGGSGSFYGVDMAADGSVFISPGVADGRVEKLDPSGRPDASFGVDGVAATGGSDVSVLALEPDGKPVLMQWRDSFGSRNITELVRLNADGSVDPSFASTPAEYWYGARVVLPDGRLVLAMPDWIPSDPAGFEVYTVFNDGRLSQPDPTSASSPSSGAASGVAAGIAPAAFGAAGAAGGLLAVDDGLRGMFDPARGVTVWNPDGTQDVYDV